MDIYRTISDWSEVWALLIPLAVILRSPRRCRECLPLVIYIIVALLLNIISVLIQLYQDEMPYYLQNNNLFYNLHAIARVILFSWYIGLICNKRFSTVTKAAIGVFSLFLAANFIFIESILDLSKWLPVAETVILLLLCMKYFLFSIKDDSETDWTKEPSFTACTAIALYVAATFFVFLFITSPWVAYKVNLRFALMIAEFYKLIFLIYCVLLAIAIYRTSKRKLPENTVFAVH
ncbi:MAG TPA: hypothetical protein VFV31_04295 [Chitinophagaceae bacterium]|nr:hypothetical protein [Chitinophagaceae bacterium]